MIKEMLPVIAAGGMFAVVAVVGLVVGIFFAGRTGSQLWVLVGLLIGLGVGGFAAYRSLQRSR